MLRDKSIGQLTISIISKNITRKQIRSNIPVKDMLTHSAGFLATANKYRDFVVFENDEFYIKKNNGQMILFELEAEGLKKVGLLWQLLMTDNLNEDSILIWDEPEANLNPKFLPKIVKCLLELSRHGVQIFLSTHNYIFAKYFDVAKNDNDNVLFHSLYFEEKTGGVKCETQTYFENLKHYKIRSGNIVGRRLLSILQVKPAWHFLLATNRYFLFRWQETSTDFLCELFRCPMKSSANN